MLKLTTEIIKQRCIPSVYERGYDYYKRHRVKKIEFYPESLAFKAIVTGEEDYKVKVSFQSDGSISSTKCSCKTDLQYFGLCKHIVALLLILKDKNEEGYFEKFRYKKIAKRIFDSFGNRLNMSKTPVELEVTYEFNGNNKHYNAFSSNLIFKIGLKKLYVVKNIKNLIESIITGEEIQYGKDFSFNPSIHTFKQEDMPLIDMLLEHYGTENLDSYFFPKTYMNTGKISIFKDKRFIMPSYVLKRFFSLYEERTFRAVINGVEYSNMVIRNQEIPVNFNLSMENDRLHLAVYFNGDIFPLTDGGEYFFCGGQIYKVPEKQRQYFEPFYNAVVEQKSNVIKFLGEDRERFVSEVLPYVEKAGTLFMDDKVLSVIEKTDLAVEIYLDKRDEEIFARVEFIYGERRINPFSPSDKSTGSNNGSARSNNGKILARDVEKEQLVLDILGEANFIVRNNEIVLEDEEKIFDFIYTTIPKLQEHANIFYSESFKNIRIKSFNIYSGKIRLNTDTDMLEFSFDLDGIDRSELSDIFSSLREKKKYYKLKNGSFLSLDSDSMKEFAHMLEYLELEDKTLNKDIIEIPKFKALYLDQELRRAELNNIVRNSAFKELVHSIKEPADLDMEIPSGLKNVLRDYQKFGFKWLKILSHYRMGGILADDMGLGKTLQIIALIASDIEEKGKKPSLIVVPTSLIFNWQAEVEKFAPNLNVVLITGSRNDRQKLLDAVKDADIVITSYPLIRRDIDYYSNMVFRYCILDEAQHIKNPESISAKSVKQLKAEKRFALTGTPMENSLSELWSIFDFIMPGYLFGYSKFVEKYERPIVKNDDKNAIEDLRRHIKPFILRRLKTDVLKELPEKIENKMVVELTDEQKKIYIAYLEKIKEEIAEEIREKGFQKSHIKIIAGLTRLRQICCHPSIFLEDFKGESGKFLMLQEIVQESIESGHRILLFSQFTSMLAIIRQWLEKEKIRYVYLDGSTPAEERGKMTRDFNNGSGDIFLISLKAGGTGLNLTGADTVIHYDPWWNPAVEEQATDRAYRIGQNKSVYVMKLITKGTVEEKIYDLQERKRNLINAVIEPGETLLTKLTEEEIRNILSL